MYNSGMAKLYTTIEAAALNDISPGRVRQMIAEKVLTDPLHYQKLSRDILITVAGLRAIAKRSTKPGPKKASGAK